MARGDYPSAKQDQFVVRLPDGMREQIKAAADENRRSMNAEIVARLDSTFPRIAYEPNLPERIGERHDDIVARHIGSYRALMDNLYEQFEQRMKEELDAFYAGYVPELEQAEITSDLEEKYPPSSPLYSKSPDFDLNIGYFYWLQDQNEWIRLSDEVWDTLRFGKKFTIGRKSSHSTNNYFAVLVFEDDGELINIIPHMYKVDEKGNVVGGVFDFLSDEENREYNRIYTLQHTSPDEDEFIRRVQDKMSPFLRPPLRARIALRELLRKSTPARTLDEVLHDRDWLTDEGS